MTMRERTEVGKLFTDYCEGLPEDRINCKKRMIQFNSGVFWGININAVVLRVIFCKYCSHRTIFPYHQLIIIAIL